jgi:hypothetical protein
VGTTAQLDVFDAGFTTNTEGLHVMELKEPGFTAPPAVVTHECTPTVIARPNLAPHGSGNVP